MANRNTALLGDASLTIYPSGVIPKYRVFTSGTRDLAWALRVPLP
jgi:hypothetical protein